MRYKNKIASVLLIAALLISAFAIPALADAAKYYGDVDGDGSVTSSDARFTLRAAVKLEKLSEAQKKRADLNGDGSIGSDDARLVLRTAVKLERLVSLSGSDARVPDGTTRPDDTTKATEPTKPAGSGSTTPPTARAVSVRPAAWADIEWEDYSNQYFTLKKPKGWEIKWGGNAQKLEWMVTNPDLFVGMYNLDHNYACKDPYMMQTLGINMYLQYGTVQEYFETLYSNTTDRFTVENSIVPANKDQLQAMRPTTPIRDYQSLYATFSENGVEGEGVYSAVIMESRDVIYGGRNYGLWEINCTFTEWTPLGELVNWQPIFDQIAKSFAYTDYYVQEWIAVLGYGSPDSSTINDTDPVLEAFEERSKADTILQEKRSDMIGEYERVYDNDTGNIYRAYNGFLDDMGDQSRYIPITDNQYAEGFVGWIDKD